MSARKITTIALIAATYVVLTILFAPLSYNYIQFRISEILTVLPFFTPLAIPGLFLGAIIANLNSPFGLYDVMIGSLATLIAAWFTAKMPNRWLAPLPPVIVNALMIGTLIATLGGIPVSIGWAIFYVGIGQLGVCYLLGIPFTFVLERIKHLFPKN